MSKAMKHESEIIKFNPTQASKLLGLLEKHDVDFFIDDCDASEMFSELLVESLRLLSVEQVKELMEAV